MAIPPQEGSGVKAGDRPDAVLIAGPTASGKSGMALNLANRWGGEIVNVDSMQIYPVLDVLTARPPVDDLNRFPHHLYGCADPAAAWSVERWRLDAERVMADIRHRGAVPIFVGGTGLYFRALDDGLSRVPEISSEIRESVRNNLQTLGSEALHKQLKTLDEAGAFRLKPGDSHRIARALEVVLSTGKPLAHFQAELDSPPLTKGLNCERIVLFPPRLLLHERINARAEWMLDNGAIEEVEKLLALDLPASATLLKAIGVRQISEYLCGKIDRPTLVAQLQAATRQYAKRQCTWFRGQFGPEWRFLTEYQS